MSETALGDRNAKITEAPGRCDAQISFGKELVVRDLSSSDYEKLAELLQAVWGLRSSLAYWQWKFAFNSGAYCGAVVAEKSGAILAFTGLFARKVVFGGREITAEWIVDLMGHPSHKGAYPLLFKELKKLPFRSFTGGFHNDEGGRITMAALRRTNSHKLSASIPRFRVVLDPSILFKGALKKPIRAAGFAAYRAFLRLRAAPRGCVIAQAATVGPEFDALWERTKGGYRYVQYRGSDYLRWRFQEMPGRAHQIWTATANGALEAYMITTLVKDARGCHGVIVDWFMPRDSTGLFRALLRRALDFFVEKGAWGVDIHIMAHERQWIGLLRKHLFFKGKGRVYSIWVVDEVISGSPIAEDMLFITPGDSDFPGIDEPGEKARSGEPDEYGK